MGLETHCTIRHAGRTCEGKALLESSELVFRGKPVRLRIPFEAVSEISVEDGTLHLTWDDQSAELDLGASAEKWLRKIANPRSVVDKLGVKAGMKVSIVDVADPSLREMLEARDVEIHEGKRAKENHIVFFGANVTKELSALPAIRTMIRPNGSIWVIRPKGTPAISDADVMRAAKEAGLVDVKVVSFSERLTAEKLVIPVKDR